jgi:hypothetical protein
MELQIKPNRWSCTPTAFAMVLGVPVSHLLEWTGHDGSEVLFPDLPEPAHRRGHHIQELIEVCLWLGYSVTPIELFPQIAATPQRTGGLVFPDHRAEVVIFGNSPEVNWRRFNLTISSGRGVITGMGHNCGHAVAYDCGTIYDPDGRQYEFSRESCEQRGFYAQCAWELNRLL